MRDEFQCFICGKAAEGCHLRACNGYVVSPAFPCPTGLHPCCQSCYLLYRSGWLRTYDHYFWHLFGLLTDGAGI